MNRNKIEKLQIIHHLVTIGSWIPTPENIEILENLGINMNFMFSKSEDNKGQAPKDVTISLEPSLVSNPQSSIESTPSIPFKGKKSKGKYKVKSKLKNIFKKAA